MGRNWLFGARTREATPAAVVATGAAGGGGWDPVDGDHGFVALGGGQREQPWWTTEKARVYSIAAYRSNPMARAIIDTYTSFIVGDSGVSLQCDHPDVRAVVDAWWNDPRNSLGKLQPLLCREWMLMGEFVPEYMVGELTGVVRFSPIDPARIASVTLDRGNPLWHKALILKGGDPDGLPIVAIDDETELRTGRVGFFPSWRALTTDRRGVPFLAPVLDDIDAYGQVLSNLIDRTALARYLVWDVTVDGDLTAVDDFIKQRGGTHVPRSGSVEVHNKGVEWAAKTADTGSYEDTNTSKAVLTNVAGGSGLARTWLADPEDANRATSVSMAEPIRRRVGGVQNEWIDGIMTEMARFVVDQAVAVGRLPRQVPTTSQSGEQIMVPPAQLVKVIGPDIAASDSKVTADVLLNLSTALDRLVVGGVMSKAAAQLAAKKAWQQFVGQPMPAGLTVSDTSSDGVTEAIDAAGAHLRIV